MTRDMLHCLGVFFTLLTLSWVDGEHSSAGCKYRWSEGSRHGMIRCLFHWIGPAEVNEECRSRLWNKVAL